MDFIRYIAEFKVNFKKSSQNENIILLFLRSLSYTINMRIVKEIAIRDYCRQYAPVAGVLRSWLWGAMNAEWTNIQDTQATFPSADAVPVEGGNRTATVFDITDNFRLITHIHYNNTKKIVGKRKGIVFIRHFLTHTEYDKNRWKENL